MATVSTYLPTTHILQLTFDKIALSYIYLSNSISFCVNWRYQYITVTNQCLFSFEVKIYIQQKVQTLLAKFPQTHVHV